MIKTLFQIQCSARFPKIPVCYWCVEHQLANLRKWRFGNLSVPALDFVVRCHDYLLSYVNPGQRLLSIAVSFFEEQLCGKITRKRL